MAFMSLACLRWNKKSKLRSLFGVIRGAVNAACEASRQQADDDSLFEIRQLIASLREFQSDGEESDLSEDDAAAGFMAAAPVCYKHPEGGRLVGVCPYCLRASLTRLAAAEEDEEDDALSGDSSPERESPAGVPGTTSGAPKDAKQLRKASAPLAALKASIPRSKSLGAQPAGSAQPDQSGATKVDAVSSCSQKCVKCPVADEVEHFRARAALRRPSTGHASDSKSFKENAASEEESGQVRGVKRSNWNRNASLVSRMLGERRKSSKDPKAKAKEEEDGDSDGGKPGTPAQPGHTSSWVSRLRSRRHTDAQSVPKKVAVSALVHPDGVTV